MENETMEQAFASYTLETAPEGSRPMLEGAKKKFGIVPAPLGKLAASPQFLEAFEAGNAIWQKTTLSALEREVVVMVVARENGCEYCVALHTQLLGALRADAATIAALREGEPLPDPKLQALASFTRAVLEARGKADPSAFFAAGYGARHALDVVVGVGTYTLTTYANRLVDVELDPGLERFRWEKRA
jgi:uncharacterized peroxidase-related enzyme